MVISTDSSKTFSTVSTSEPRTTKSFLWDQKYIIPNLPPYVYTDNEPPNSIRECQAKISSVEYTIKDIDLQIEIRQSELNTGNSRYKSTFDFEQWRCQALKAKQSQYYFLNAYKYWFILNDTKELDVAEKLDMLIELLIEDPSDFVQRADRLLH